MITSLEWLVRCWASPYFPDFTWEAFTAGVGDDQSDGGGRTADDRKAAHKGHQKPGCLRLLWRNKQIQMPGLTDVQFTGVYIGQLETDLDGGVRRRHFPEPELQYMVTVAARPLVCGSSWSEFRSLGLYRFIDGHYIVRPRQYGS